MSRSLKKGVYVHPKLLKKVLKVNAAGGKGPIKTWARASQITPDMIGITFQVHNGHKFIDVTVVENMVGHRLGEFSPTRTFRGHGGKMAKDQAAAESSAEKARVQAAQAA
ncbi:MAG: 30S ribosomal protein S19 [Candidatus Kerfeldbacteria bacterium CG15_BIG_FIL_POST_REV_8_21_14_020_45_12]|uniref:Small ribosomal subunit protein uS19 n=1 Tax=Candidatus Kerfeldbacteria bacterium CG15_BIG_FIL_POST_REV_8_21_14_020_45_12 TaxID=2014247 RepID=A0A2M7H3R4_9BACT|nr:MAG: 30S ribosomal protein S19 [Candidatus Kerfeldbacteria bacterium CG15_BIG_FIL_POST_REV_8_21_14_020_45_12]PJA93988.1 MAG: 30S ribosomal protein S19 [Candidatus Kerfeldbacteria bacterium CG_4_9_14_3_um_filter_45_8]